MKEISANGRNIRIIQVNGEDYPCLTDIARAKNPDFPADVVRNWMRSKMTISFLGLWETLNNPDFKLVEFDHFKQSAGLNSFVLPPQIWIEKTNAKGMVSKSGRYGGGTFAHHDIAFEFASWISPEFKLYLITDYQRLKKEEQKQLGWSVKRELAKINYRIHTDAIQRNLLPPEVTRAQMSAVYASEADILNVALFGMTHAQWLAANPRRKGNQRDYASISELICLSNLENINAVMIGEGVSQSQRLCKLNQIAIHQMKILSEFSERGRLK